MYLLPVGSYSVEYGSFVGFDVPGFASGNIVFMNNILGPRKQLVVSADYVFTVTEEMLMSGVEEAGYPPIYDGFCMIYVNSYGRAPVVRVYNEPVVDNPSMETATGIYYQAFDMIAGFIYGEGAELTAEQNMVLTTLATTLALSVFVVPFLLIIWFIRMFR